MYKGTGVKLEFYINDVCLGEKLDSKYPKNDVVQYLVINRFKVNFERDGKVYIIPEKTSIKEYPIEYCEECLKKGKRNKECHYGSYSKTEQHSWCKECYAKVMRKHDSVNACPKCANGYMKEAGIELEMRRCTHCEYSVPIPGRGTFGIIGRDTIESYMR